MWSKDGSFVKGLHTFGHILTKISVNCVIHLHVALLFTCLFLWVYSMCGYNCLYSYGYCLYMLYVCVYFYFSMNPCNYKMDFSIYILYIKIRNSSLCICFNCM
jgi:FtsH-binding integral membrane protein